MNFIAIATNTQRGIAQRRIDPELVPGLRSQIAELEAELQAEKRAKRRAEKDAKEKTDLIFDLKDKIEILEERLARYTPSAATARDVLNEVSAFHQVPTHVIIGTRGSAKVINARQHAAYEIRRRCPWVSYPEMARLLCRDHSTLIYAVEKWPEKARALGIPVLPLDEVPE